MIARLFVVDESEEYEQRPVVVDHRGVAVPIPPTAGFDFGQQFAHRLPELVALSDLRATHPHFRGHCAAFLLKRSGCLPWASARSLCEAPDIRNQRGPGVSSTVASCPDGDYGAGVASPVMSSGGPTKTTSTTARS